MYFKMDSYHIQKTRNFLVSDVDTGKALNDPHAIGRGEVWMDDS